MQNRAAQTVSEYAVLLVVVTAALAGMQVYSKRAIEAAIKTAADAMSPYAAARDVRGNLVGDAHGELAQIAGSIYETGKRTDDDLIDDGHPANPDDGYMPGDVLVNNSQGRTTSTSRLTSTGLTGGGVARTVGSGQEQRQTVGTLATCGAYACTDSGVRSYSEVIADRLYR